MSIRHTEMLNRIITAKGYTSYLEIGLGSGRSFDAVKAVKKIGIDPVLPATKTGQTYRVTSDEFFQRNQITFDCIFIDGLHHYRQVVRDIEHALDSLSPHGLIMVHDCNPPSKAAQQVPRNGERLWTGDVWRAWVKFRRNPKIHQVCVAEDYGCGMITHGEQEPLVVHADAMLYEELDQDRQRLLNLINWEDYERLHVHS